MAKHRCLLCAPLIATSVAEMIEHMELARDQGADIVELRVDHIIDFNPPSHLPILLSRKPLPVIVTFRPQWEGGKFVGDESSRQNALQLALNLGADFIDIELKVATDFLACLQGRESSSCKIIVSNHNFQSTPSAEELGTLIAKMQSTGADVVKFVTTANKFTDVVTVLEVLRGCQIKICMGIGELVFHWYKLLDKYIAILSKVQYLFVPTKVLFLNEKVSAKLQGGNIC